MSGFGKAMRFTSITMLCGGLALAAFPGTSGFFSKDEILAYATARGGMYLIFTVLGYFGALLTAIYTFRLIFRVLPGTPVQGGAGADRHRPRRPRGAAQPGDRRGGGHRRRLPRRRPPYRRAVGCRCGSRWACSPSWRCSPAWSRSRASTTSITKFLDPVFADSPLAAIHPSVAASWTGLAIGAAISRRRHRDRLLPLRRAARDPGDADPPPARRCTPSSSTSGTSTSSIDFLVVRPALAIGRFANRTFERIVVDGLITGTEDVVGGAGRRRPHRAERLRPQLRAAPDRRLRRARPLLPARTPHDQLGPLDTARLRPRRPLPAEAGGRLVGGAGTRGDAGAGDRPARRLRLRRARACRTPSTSAGSPASASTTASGSTGSTSSWCC